LIAKTIQVLWKICTHIWFWNS